MRDAEANLIRESDELTAGEIEYLIGAKGYDKSEAKPTRYSTD